MSSKSKNIQDIYTLTPMQEGMLFHALYEKSSAYFEQTSYRMHGELNITNVEKSLNLLFERYDILRTAFVHEGVKRPVQVVLKNRKVEFNSEDLRNIGDREEKERRVREYKLKDRERSFDLVKDVLMRVSVLQLTDTEFEYIWSHHHIIMDGWCMGILISEYAQLYLSLQQNIPCQLPPVVPYRKYIEWLEKQDKQSSQNYWQKYLESYEETAGLPQIQSLHRTPIAYKKNKLGELLDEETSARIEEMAGENFTTVNIIAQAVWGIVLGRYNNRRDVVFGAVVSGRPADLRGVETMVGLFINTLPIRVRYESDQTFKKLVEQLRQDNINVQSHQHYPLADIQANTVLKGNLIDHLMVFENFPVEKMIDEGSGGKAAQAKPQTNNQPSVKKENGVRLSNIDSYEQVNYDFCLILKPGDRLIFGALFNENQYEPEFIKRLMRQMKRVFQQIAANENILIDNIELLSEEEKKEVLESSMGIDAPLPTNRQSEDNTIHRLFEQKAREISDQTALLFEEQRVSYGDLNKQANRLAWLLKEKGIGPDSIVGVMMNRSPQVVVSMLAIMKAGGAYLPIDPDYPTERIHDMLEDSHTSILITNGKIAAQFSETDLNSIKSTTPESTTGDNIEKKSVDREFLLLDEIDWASTAYPDTNPEPVNTPRDLVYEIYTSGSTGKPKGVLLEHRNLVNLMEFQYHHTNIDFSSVLQFTSISFDVSFQEIFSTLLAGGTLTLIDNQTRTDIPKLFDIIKTNNIKTLFLPASFLKFVLQEEEYVHLLPSSVEHVVTAGEQVVVTQEFRNYLKSNNIYLHNHYGPAETHVVTTLTVDPQGEIPDLPSIGKPVSNTSIYIVDQNRHLQPVGVPGELWIGGVQVGRGYWQKDELTREKFIEDPFHPGESVYCTGDLARQMPDGNIEFLGRIDHQVKVRGFRVEPGEIEARILSSTDVKEAAVIALQEKMQNVLCAYVVPQNPDDFDPSTLRDRLAGELPDYMVPSYFVVLKKIPLTPNRKLDKAALPAPDSQSQAGEYCPPTTETEKKLAAIWAEVLGMNVESISINDNFFQLGGHSLKATILTSRVHKLLEFKLSLPQVFENPTIQAMARILDKAKREKYISIDPVEKREFYVLSPAQKRMFLLQQMDDSGTVYNLPSIMIMEGILDTERIESAFNELVKRHENLRTSFVMNEGIPVQIVHPQVEFKIKAYKYNEEEPVFQDGEMDHTIIKSLIKEFIRPFDLGKAPLFRVEIIHFDNNHHLFMMDTHHIISDGVSNSLFIDEFRKFYTGRGDQLSPLKIQYKDYAHWSAADSGGALMAQQKEFWVQKYTDDIPVLELPTDFPRPPVQSFEGSTISFNISVEESRRINALIAKEQVTPFIFLLSAFHLLLWKMTGQEDIIVGTPMAGRRHADLEPIIGMFVNTLALRNRSQETQTFREFLGQIKSDTLQSFENQEYPFEDLVEQVSVKRDAGRNPLFDVVFVFQTPGSHTARPQSSTSRVTQPSEKATESFKATPYGDENPISKFDMTLLGIKMGEQLGFSIEYCTRLFKGSTINRFRDYFLTLVSAVTNRPSMQLKEIDILTLDERQRLLYDFNNTDAPYPESSTIHQLFAQQVEKTPDHIALIGESELSGDTVSLTYRELAGQSLRLARILRKKGVVPDTVVCLLAPRTVEMVSAILGILTAGGAYLPIDPEYPQERVRYILSDSGTPVLVTTKALAAENNFDGEHAYIEETITAPGTDSIEDDSPLYTVYTEEETGPSPSDIAYIIYTSGTTGQPKGMMIEHRNVVRLMVNQRFQFDFHPGDVWTMFHSYNFDFSVWEMYGSLLYGGKCVVVSRITAKDTPAFLDLLKREAVTILNQTPSAFYQLCGEELKITESQLNVRTVIFGGEALQPLQLKEWRKKYPKTRLINMFGITETTVHVTYKEIGENEITYNISNIGGPIPTLSTYVVDKHLQLLPIGIAGELLVAGDGVGRGYLNRPQLTSEKFVPNPFNSSKRVYRSGDLVKIDDSGDMEYMGRIDHQVKIRGFRIELGEIESRLLAIDGIESAIVIVRSDDPTGISTGGDKYLCAYLVSQEEILVSQLRESLANSLPDYMIPAHFVYLETIPLTANGKIDRKALPSPQLNVSGEYTPPQTLTQEKLVEIWAEILGLEKEVIGIDHDFFELGGHSLKATNMTTRISKELNVKVPLVEVFRSPDIRGLAQYIDGLARETFCPIDPVEKKSFYPLSSTQKRLFVLQQIDTQNIGYNMPQVIPLPMVEINIPFLQEVFQKLIQRHESLRTSFQLLGTLPIQRIHDTVPFEIERFETDNTAKNDQTSTQTSSQTSAQSIIQNFIRPFDLSKPPLLRVGILSLPDGAKILLVDTHHIISDGASNRIIRKDFLALARGETPPPLRIQYKDFSQWQNQELDSETLLKQEQFWINRYWDSAPVLELPTDYARPMLMRFEGSAIYFTIGRKDTARLKEMSREYGTTMYMLLLSLFNVLLARLSNQEDIIVGTPVAGRTHADLERIMGMFVNTLVIRSFPEKNKSFTVFLNEVKTETLEAFDNQDYPFETLVGRIKVPRDTSRNPLFDVMFTYNQFDTAGTATPDEVDDDDENEWSAAYEETVSKFDLTLHTEVADKTFCTFEYSTRLFKPETIEKFAQWFKRIVSELSTNPKLSLEEVDLLSDEEKQKVIVHFNKSEAEYPQDKTIHTLILEQAQKNPDNIAVITPALGEQPEVSLTFQQLADRSQSLAAVLRDKGICRGEIVALMAQRSQETIIAIMAILQAGGAFLPIDPLYPPARKKYLLQDSRANVLITQTDILQKDKSHIDADIVDNILFLDDLPAKPVVPMEQVLPEHTAHVNDPAYIIYTSGTTGNPKGVMVEHRGVVNYIWWAARNYVKNDRVAFPFYTSIAFDLTVTSVFTPLVTANSVVIYEDSGDKTPLIHRIIDENRVGVIKLTPSHLKLLESREIDPETTSVKRFIVGGEALDSRLALEIHQKFAGKIEIYNEYGPTETVVGCMIHCFNPETDKGAGVPIGIPAANTGIYILDSNGRPQAPGIIGELYIGGHGVARGYLNNPQMTADKFIPNQLSNNSPPGSRLYRTGDLARMLPEGVIEFMGRVDSQVKIRGYRIEPGEIESLLRTHEDINEAAVIPQIINNEKHLSAYIASEKEFTTPQLRAFLGGQLPEYMIPSYFITVEKIPLTVHGKIDQKALEGLGRQMGTGIEFVAPGDDYEKTIADAWKQVLLVEQVGVNDNFFDLGGNSLMVVQLNSILSQAFDRPIPVVMMFRYTTIRTFAQYLKDEENNAAGTQQNQPEDRSEAIEKAKRGRADRRAKRKRN